MKYPTRGAANRHPDPATMKLATGLGIFSIVLGMMEVVAGRTLARALGLSKQESLIRGYGVREIGTGLAILSSGDPTPWIWGRVFGDGLDLGTLLTALDDDDNDETDNVGLAIGAVLGATAADVYCACRLTRETRHASRPAPDYHDRSGLPRSAAEMRGAARDFEVPRDFRTPELLRPLTQSSS